MQQSAQYDPASRLTSLSTSGASGLNPSTYSYGYNALGWTTSATGISGTDTITHDALGRITAESGPSVLSSIPGRAYHWTYDGNGNLLTGTDDVGTVYTDTYSTSQPNQLMQSYDPDPHSNPTNTLSFGYDRHGDTTAITTSGPLTASEAISTGITYDAQERPITITHKAADYSTKAGAVFDTISVQYNALGQRARYTVVVSGTAILDQRFSYRDDGAIGQVAAMTATLNTNGTIKSSGAYTDTYVYGPVGEPLEFARQQNGQINRYWYVLDGNGSVVAVTDASGAVVDSYAYDQWGEPLPDLTTQQVPQQLRYDGYWEDDAVGWYWVSIRYYDPEIMRWMQPDPTEVDGVHTYVYVGDDPVDVSDPTGQGNPTPGPAPTPNPRPAPTPTGTPTPTPRTVRGRSASSSSCDLPVIGRVLCTNIAVLLVFVPGTGHRLQALAFVSQDRSLTQVTIEQARMISSFGFPLLFLNDKRTTPYLQGALVGLGLGKLTGRQILVTAKGLDIVERHLGRFENVPENEMMVARLRSALENGEPISGANASFYLHEIAEATLMDQGIDYEIAHAAALAKYRVSPFSVYAPEVIQEVPGSFNENWTNFWRELEADEGEGYR